MRSSARGSIGARTLRSAAMKPALPATPTASAASTAGDRQPCVGASMKAYTMPPSPAVASSAPHRSSPPLAEAPRLSGTCRHTIHSTPSAIGTLMRKAQVQEK